jgi:hypothetical protein
MGERTILHSGPPIPWARMCGPMQGATALVERGEVDFAPCHHQGLSWSHNLTLLAGGQREIADCDHDRRQA